MSAAELPDQSPPGELLSADPMTAYLLPRVRLRARAWHIRYRSTTATGQPAVVSGVVLVPPTPYPGRGPRPVIGYAPGTQGLSDASAPSRQLARGTEYEAAGVALMLRRGWAVALTDYPGLGTPGNHPYVVGRALGPAVLDCVRAARQIGEAGLDVDGPVGIFGSSEGGHAAGWALQLHPGYAPELDVRAGAVGAAPIDLESIIPHLDGGPFAFLLIYGCVGLNAAYPELGLLDYLNDRGRRAVDRFNRTRITTAIAMGAAMFPKRITGYTAASPFEEPQVLSRMRENRLGTLAPSAPVLVGAGTLDPVIPYHHTATLYRDWRTLGVQTYLRRIPITEHLSGCVVFAPAAMKFLGRHFVG